MPRPYGRPLGGAFQPTLHRPELDLVTRCPECKRIVLWIAADQLGREEREIGRFVRAGFLPQRLTTVEARAEPSGHTDACTVPGKLPVQQRGLFEGQP